MLNAGKLKHVVKIFAEGQKLGDYGVETTQVDQGKRRAYVVPQGETESAGIDGQQLDNRYKVIMRLDECMTSDKWITWKTKTLKITGITHFDVKRETVLDCIEHPTRLAG